MSKSTASGFPGTDVHHIANVRSNRPGRCRHVYLRDDLVAFAKTDLYTLGMVKTRAYRRLTYKKAHGSPGNSNLQTRLKSALAAKSKSAEQRCFNLDNDGSSFRGMDEMAEKDGMLFGTLMDVVKGSHHPTVKADLSGPSLARGAAAPPRNSEYLDAFLFFGVQGDHVVVVQSGSLRASHFEKYCNWLLHPGENETAHPVQLLDLPIRGVRNATGVKRLTLSQPIGFSNGAVRKEIAARANDKKLKKSERKERPGIDNSVRVEVVGHIRDLIRQFAPDKESVLSSLKFDQALSAGRVKATVVLEVTGQMKEDDAVPLVDEIAASLRHVEAEDLDYEIVLNDGQVVTPNEVKYFESVLVTCEDGIPNFSEICDAMHTWLVASVQSRRVY